MCRFHPIALFQSMHDSAPVSKPCRRQPNRSGLAVLLLTLAASLPLAVASPRSTAGEAVDLPLENAAFAAPELPAADHSAADRADGWHVQHAGVFRNDSGFGKSIEGAHGEQLAHLAGHRPAALAQATPHRFEPNTRYQFSAGLALREDAPLANDASLALKIQHADPETGQVLANLAVRTVIVGRDPLADSSLTDYTVEFTTTDVPPPGTLRIALEVVTPAPGDSGNWTIDAARLSARPAETATEELAVVNQDLSLSYNFHVRPILSSNCFACHGPDPEDRAAGLRLDTREGAIEDVIVPGDPDASEVMRRITSTDPADIMPPPEAHTTLSSEEIDTIRTWIAEGAHYEQHWSFAPLQQPEPPAVEHDGWARNPIDRFILARMQEDGLEPNEEADRRTLVRRLSLDLTGLPPSPAMVEAFVNDDREEAYDELIDQLMASPHWGEHRARYWLDVARYADTHGIHFDNYREIWGYRDWVIQAYNRNLPFDEFTIEQLAGDLLPEPTEQQLIATGYNRCNITTNEGGIIDEEYKVLYSIDRTETLGATWLGLTVACAACHDHKYDPFPASDFYSLAAFFNNSTVPVRDGNRKDPGPTLMLFDDDDRERWTELEQAVPAAEQELASFDGKVREQFTAWLDGAAPADIDDTVPTEGLVYQAPLSEVASDPVEGEDLEETAIGGTTKVLAAGTSQDALIVPAPVPTEGPDDNTALLLEQPGAALPGAPDVDTADPFSFGLWVRLPDVNQTGALIARMDDGSDYRGFDLWLQGGQLAAHIIDTWPDNAIKVVGEGKLENNRWHHVFLTWDGSGKASGLTLYIDGIAQPANATNDSLQGTIATEVPLRLGRRHLAQGVNGLAVTDLRWFDRRLQAAEVDVLVNQNQLRQLLAKAADADAELTDEEKERLFKTFIAREDPDTRQQLERAVAALKAEQEQIRERTPITHIFREADTLPTSFVLHRGEYDQRRDLVPADTPGVLPPMSGDLPRNRLGLAQWLLADENPLTARVTVNRFWSEIFGRGLVETPGDFGLSGMLPSHPELLDWLAVEFRDNDWDIQQFYRLMVTSATYRQAARVTPDKLEVDPENRLLARGPRFRMDAEMIRDHALAASGILVPDIGGPSVKPYQPDGVWEAVAMPGSNTRNYQRDSGDALYRRSMYTFWKRSAPPASMDVFNAPNRETCTPERERTNTPLQALVTLNDPQFVEAARFLATRVLKEHEEQCDRSRVDFIAMHLIARPLRDEEHEVVARSLEAIRDHYQNHPEDAGRLIAVGESQPPETLNGAEAELAAWTMICNELMNLDEVLNK